MPTTTQPTHKQQIAAALNAVQAIAEAIRELKQVPAGHLYAHLAAHMSLDQFYQIIALLIKANLVHQDDSHLLHWTGPNI